jgi:hypothetical protein
VVHGGVTWLEHWVPVGSASSIRFPPWVVSAAFRPEDGPKDGSEELVWGAARQPLKSVVGGEHECVPLTSNQMRDDAAMRATAHEHGAHEVVSAADAVSHLGVRVVLADLPIRRPVAAGRERVLGLSVDELGSVRCGVEVGAVRLAGWCGYQYRAGEET